MVRYSPISLLSLFISVFFLIFLLLPALLLFAFLLLFLSSSLLSTLQSPLSLWLYVPSLKSDSYHIPILFTICHLPRWGTVRLRDSQVEMVRLFTRRVQHCCLLVTWLIFLPWLSLLHRYPFANSGLSKHGARTCYPYYKDMLCWCFWGIVSSCPLQILISAL